MTPAVRAASDAVLAAVLEDRLTPQLQRAYRIAVAEEGLPACDAKHRGTAAHCMLAKGHDSAHAANLIYVWDRTRDDYERGDRPAAQPDTLAERVAAAMKEET